MDISILIVSYNTSAILKQCLESIEAGTGSLAVETIVVDNDSRDDSVEMMRREFPWVKVVESRVNLGFGGANNRAYEEATGKYIVMLNSDAFLGPDSLKLSIEKIEADPKVGLAGGRLVGLDGSPQPSARMFPTLTNHFLGISGLADKYPKSKFCGQFNRTWADRMLEAEVDWVPGCYSIIPDKVLKEVGFFDPMFFFYHEEVDLCFRIQKAGYKVMYWPDIEIVHIGGASARKVKTLEISEHGAQIMLWSLRSTLLFYRKHLGPQAQAVRWLEVLWHRLRSLRNKLRGTTDGARRATYHRQLADLMQTAWKETNGGRTSPAKPW